MKKLFLSLVLLTVGALALSEQVEILAVEDYEDRSGFSGYGWGTSWAYIVLDMEDANYDLLYGDSATRKDLWYRGKINGEAVRIVYYFEKGVLASGMWVIDDVDQPSFWAVNQYLLDSYGSKVELTVENDSVMEAEMLPPGTDAWIIHNLDVGADRHVVHYYYRPGGE